MGLFSKLKNAVIGEGTEAQPSATSSPSATVPPQDPLFTPPEAWSIDTDALKAPPPVVEGDALQVGPADPTETARFQQPIIDVIRTVYDPEIPVDIYELGLIYDIIVDADRKALIKMTLTSPACPSAQQVPNEVRYKVKSVPGVADAWVEIVWEPPWDKDRMSEAAKLSLGFF